MVYLCKADRRSSWHSSQHSNSFSSDGEDAVSNEGSIISMQACACSASKLSCMFGPVSTSEKATPRQWGNIVLAHPAIPPGETQVPNCTAGPTLLRQTTNVGHKSGLCKDTSNISIFASQATLASSGFASPPQSPTASRHGPSPALAIGGLALTASRSRSLPLVAHPRHQRVRSPRATLGGGSVTLSAQSTSSLGVRAARSPSPGSHHKSQSRSLPRLQNRTGCLVKPPLTSRTSLSSMTTCNTTADVQPSMSVPADSMEPVPDALRASIPKKGSKARYPPGSPRGHFPDDQKDAESGLSGKAAPPGILTPRTKWWPGEVKPPQGISSAPAVPDGQADKQSMVVRALSARLPHLAELFGAASGTQECSMLSNDVQLPVLYFSD